MRVAVALAASVIAAVTLSAQVFRAGTDTVLLVVTAAEANGHPVTNLTAPDFQIFEDGQPQTLSVFSGDRQPIALSLLLDTSASMEPKLATAQEAAVGFCKRLGPHDVAQVIEFNNGVQIRQPFTASFPDLERAIRGTHVGGSTALYSAIYVALNDLDRIRADRTEEVRRQAIVLLSDGNDTASLPDYEQVIEQAKRASVLVYAVGLQQKEHGSDSFDNADYVLRSLAQQTGGRVFFVSNPSELSGVYAQIADELATQYILGYVSRNPKSDGGWRQVSVKIARPGASARTRLGYFAPLRGR